MITRPTISIPVITFLPSAAALSPARNVCSSASIGATLAQPFGVSRKCALDGVVACASSSEPLQRPGIVVEPQRGPRAVERSLAEQRCGGRPHGGVALDLLRLEISAHRDQLREVVDGLDCAHLLDADETVCVQIVTEQERAVVVLGCKEPRLAVVKEVALVDRLDAEGVPRLGKQGEDRLVLLLLGWPRRGNPERALAAGLADDRVPWITGRSRQRPRSSGRSRRRRARATGTSPRTGSERRRCRARAGDEKARRTGRRRRPAPRRSRAPDRPS